MTMNGREGLIDELFHRIRNQLKDLSYFEVITAAGNTSSKINPDSENLVNALEQQVILARTRIELDGDVILMIPADTGTSGDLKINKEIIDIHKQNVDTAVSNWNNFMNSVLRLLELITQISGIPRSEVMRMLWQ